MAGQRDWAERVAARAAGRPAPVEETPAVPERPAWARAAVDRAQGRTPDAATVREAHEGSRKPRKPWENELLRRLGHDTEDGGPDAA
ncbi:hypothetical protein AB0G86_14425 [Streptomyces scabiei]|uniref:hypothetical protein n=1 Tax=Streptomyces scabiei TaxID=1930 RepID=UPI0033DE3313